jgi:hypothetical protein
MKLGDVGTPTFARAQALARALKQTAGARYAGAKRLRARYRALTRFTALLAAYVIVLTILPYVILVTGSNIDVLNLVAVLYAIMILFASLYQYSNGDIVNAEQNQKNALELDEIRRAVELRDQAITEEELAQFTQAYNAALKSCPAPQERIDYQKYQIERPQDFRELKGFDRALIWLQWNWRYHFPTAVLIAVSALTAALVAQHVLKKI